mmetsp:Transcript_12320/g.24827  ORF Transcript_12320/g.24827 Transcript_12320/m.24827 type:complete len:351 (-) Transcript_12320:33-1085(-)|eukprot:CAMPEP_0170362222 /NCGR_PEP_ID=MMETSP0117_2-20130122/4223_1 /TAXON_ID=400756 /ORGANISM="Durinskia baltica, Strain CSIRO CS-38" /LENGTH=350 /DNA_ID=CAMNT_0010616637 /DNA_START=58 /DNA_END=1110 /DNA_ORIENTATION=-
MVKLQDHRNVIEASGIMEKFQAMILLKDSPSISAASRAYAQAAANELDNGLIPGAEHLCKVCLSQLTAKKRHSSNDENSVLDKNELDSTTQPLRLRPKLALVNGYFRGKPPVELQQLNSTEISMIALINVITKIRYLPGSSGHQANAGTVFTVVNDVSVLQNSLPQNPTLEQFAFIRAPGDNDAAKQHRFSPFKVLQALQWLSRNNWLYCGKVIVPENDPLWADNGQINEVDVPYLDSSLDTFTCHDENEVAAGIDGHAVNPGAPCSAMTDVLLVLTPETDDILQQCRDLLINQEANATSVLVRATGDIVFMESTPYFIQQAFPLLYPYGRGGPDLDFELTYDKAYFKHM